jgi:hypothetical protein
MASTNAAVAISEATRKNIGWTAMPKPIANAISNVALAGSKTVSSTFFITPPLSVKAWFGAVFADNHQLALTAQILRPVPHNDHAFLAVEQHLGRLCCREISKMMTARIGL